MNPLSKILKIADIFCQRALHSYNLIKEAQGYVSPDDEGDDSLSFDMINLARDIDDVQMRSDLLELAKLYDKSLSMGVGYHTINELISKFFEKHLDGLSPYYERKYTPLTNLLNEVSTDLENRAGTSINNPDTPKTIEALKSAKDQLAQETLEEYNKKSQEQAEHPQPDQDIPEDIESEENMDPDLSDYQGDVVFDPTAGMGKDQAEKGPGRGVRTGRLYENINWKEVYDKEKERYNKIYESSTSNVVRNKVRELLNIINELEKKITLRDNIRKSFSQTPHAQKVKELNKIKNSLTEQLANKPSPQLEKQIKDFQNKIKYEIKNAPSTPEQQELNSFNQKQRELNLLRNNLKLDIRRILLTADNTNLSEAKLGKPAKAQKILDLKIRLNNLIFSRARNKAKEKTLIEALIRNLESKSEMSPEEIVKREAQIDEAAEQKIDIKDVRKQDAIKVREKKESGTLTGLIIHLQQKLATQKNEAAKAIKKKASQDPYFEPYKKAVQIAKDKLNVESNPNNQLALESAVRSEVEALKNYLENHDTIKRIKSDLAILYSFRDESKKLDELGTDPNLTGQLIVNGEKLINAYGKIYKSPVSSIKDIVEHLKSNLG